MRIKALAASVFIISTLFLTGCNSGSSNNHDATDVVSNIHIYDLPGQYSQVIEYDTAGGVHCVQSFTKDVISCVPISWIKK